MSDTSEPVCCECDNTHESSGTVCRWCYKRGRRKPDDYAVTAVFKCEKCGGASLEEVVTGSTTVSEVGNIAAGGEIEYGEQYSEDGGVDRYQCSKCGKTVLGDDGNVINDPEDLFDFLDKKKWGSDGT